ncbi:MAG: IPT/TIG domain-containing protein [Candidatus Zixiibacteriota bacterium]|nr:MAG: IPT/TIG domain-containing protein [candidate division Zixibacteria bacterium]
MNKICSDRFGGAKVHFKKPHHKMSKLALLLLAAMLCCSSSAFAQGSIFGAVTNSNATIPANGDISFYGFLDDTDEEIRIETCVGAGYDAGNWFDDFQNYLTEAPGNPYDYHFYNQVNGEGAVLSKLIPNNSFQQENISLGAVSWPLKPSAVVGRAISGSRAVVSWNAVPGETYHVYRRMASSNGSFFRIDDPTGLLSNPGVTDSFFIDNSIDGVSSYSYLVIAQDASGNLGPHSDVITVNSANVEAPVIVSIDPDSGSVVGGTAVTVSGIGFDGSGVVVSIGVGTLGSVVVVSPFEITGVTPPAPVGPVDVSVANIASGLSSAPLVGGFNYIPNMPPVLDPIGPQITTEDVNLNFTVTSSDPDGTTPTLLTSTLPGTATFVDNGDGTGTFDWTPAFTDEGLYQVTFYATDDIDTVSEVVDITVNDAGNQPPVLDSIGLKTVLEGGNLNFNVTASDPDGTIPSLSATGVPTNATFTDNADGSGTFDFNPDLTQQGTYSVTFKAFDGIEVDSEVVQIDVTETNQPPVLAAIGPQTVDEGVNLNVAVSASDGDGDPITLTTSALPGTATFTDNSDGTGAFDWTPGFTDAGSYDVMFYASDTKDIDSELVTITVNEAGNQPPVLDSIGALYVTELDTLIENITASDPDGDPVALFAEALPTNATFIDSGNGVGTLTFIPDFTQSGVYDVLFYASDGLLADSEMVELNVTESGNQLPVLTVVTDTTINEGDSLIIIVTGSDPDGQGVSLTATSALPSYRFVDSTNGVGVFSFYATYLSAGTYTVLFSAVDFADPPGITTDTLNLTIAEVNQPPVIDSLGPFGVAVGDTLTFTVTASDTTDPVEAHRIFLTAVGIPSNSDFVDNGNDSGTFTFYPDSTQVGVVSVTFIATDMGTPQLSDNFTVDITVVVENRPPVLDVGSAFTVWEGDLLEFDVEASDPDGGFPELRASNLPENAALIDNHNGTGIFTFTPSYVQSGLYGVVIEAYDGIDVTKKNVLIQVYEGGNQAPVIDDMPTQSVVEGDTIEIIITASDPDETIPTLTADSLPANASFTDNGDGTGTIDFYPTFTQSGTYYVYIYASDGEFVDTLIVTLECVEAGNQRPVLDPVSDQTVQEMLTLTFDVHSSDVDMNVPFLSGGNMPEGATLTDNHDYTGTFNWTTDNFDAGDHSVLIIATDSLDVNLADTITVNITVLDTNLYPLLFEEAYSVSLDEGDTLYFHLTAEDPDGTIPKIELYPGYELYPNMSFVDNGDGTALLTFTPDYSQGGNGIETYPMRWRAVDALDTNITFSGQVVQILVYDKNQPPHLELLIGTETYDVESMDFEITEGEIVQFDLVATDGDGNLQGIFAEDLPLNSYFGGVFYFRKTFSFTPDYTQSGSYVVLFYASDGEFADTITANISVLEAGNQAPIFTTELPDTVAIVASGFETIILLNAVDPEGDPITISVDTLPDYASFIDSGNGSAVFSFNPNLSQVGMIYTLTYVAEDSFGAGDTMIVNYRVVQSLRGDANSDTELNMLDIMFIINYLYKSGPAPAYEDAADANYDGGINLNDASFLVTYFYKGGPPPPQE